MNNELDWWNYLSSELYIKEWWLIYMWCVRCILSDADKNINNFKILTNNISLNNLLVNNTENDQKQLLNTARIEQIDQNDFLHWIQVVIAPRSRCVAAKGAKRGNQRCFREKSRDSREISRRVISQHHHHSESLTTHSLARTRLPIDCTGGDG